MKLKDLNMLLEERNFFGIKKDLETHITKLQTDVKDANIAHVASFETLALKLIDKIESLKQTHKFDVNNFDEMKRKVVGFQQKFMEYLTKYKGMTFQKEIIEKVINHLEDLVAKLEDSLDDIEYIEKNYFDFSELSKELEKESGGKASLKRKLPTGIAQDISTRKHQIYKK